MSIAEVQIRIARSVNKYGPYRSTAEALGVITEECQELIEAIHTGDISHVRNEALDLAACALKLASDCNNQELRERSE